MGVIKLLRARLIEAYTSLVMSTSYAWNVMEGKNNGERSQKSKNRVNVNFVEPKLSRKAKNVCIANVKVELSTTVSRRERLDPNGALTVHLL